MTFYDSTAADAGRNSPAGQGDPLRPLTVTEAAVLALMLSLDFPGVDDLRVQATYARVSGRCKCGCPSIELDVPDGIPLASGLSSRLAPLEGLVTAVDDKPPGEIILFVDGGRLSYLEHVYYGDAPTEWPPLSRISVSIH